MHCLEGAKLKNICRTVQVLPECLRLSKVPAVHCNIQSGGTKSNDRNLAYSRQNLPRMVLSTALLPTEKLSITRL